jgi:uncharacterized membrane protein YedE/YeeE
MLIGFWVAGQISDAYTTADVHDWSQIWLIPAGFAVGVLILFLLIFRDEKVELKEDA